MEKRTIEERIRLLEDMEQIRELYSKYNHYVDAMDLDKLMDECFTDDIIFERPPNRYEGKEKVLGFFKNLKYTMMSHLGGNQFNEVNGDTARGKAYVTVFGTLRGEKGTYEIIGSAIYDDTLRRENGRWKFSARIITFKFIQDLKKGWAEEPMADYSKM